MPQTSIITVGCTDNPNPPPSRADVLVIVVTPGKGTTLTLKGINATVATQIFVRPTAMHRVQKEYSEASTLYSEALQIWTDTGNQQGRADALWGLAQVHQFLNEYNNAIVLYSEALQIWTDIGDRQGMANALRGLHQVYRVRNE